MKAPDKTLRGWHESPGVLRDGQGLDLCHFGLVSAFKSNNGPIVAESVTSPVVRSFPKSGNLRTIFQWRTIDED
jgi:hypothetical protein